MPNGNKGKVGTGSQRRAMKKSSKRYKSGKGSSAPMMESAWRPDGSAYEWRGSIPGPKKKPKMKIQKPTTKAGRKANKQARKIK